MMIGSRRGTPYNENCVFSSKSIPINSITGFPMRGVSFIFLILILSSSLRADPQPAVLPQNLQTFFKNNCVRCHGPQEQNAKIRIDQIPTTISDEAIAQQWQDILDVLNLGQMPPEDEKQPSKRELQDTLESLTATLRDARERLTDTGGAIVIRRLNKREYKNTIRDLFGIDLDVEMLPQDGSLDGFDTPGQAHSLSSLHIERYLSVGRKALEETYFPITGKKVRGGAPDKRRDPETKINDEMKKNLPKMKAKLAQARRDVAAGKKYRALGGKTKEVEIPIAEEYLKRPEIKTGVLLPFRGAPGEISFPLAPWGNAPKGRYRIKIRFGLVGDQKHDNVFLQVVRGERGSASSDEVHYFHVNGTMDNPQEISFEFAADGALSNHFSIRRRSLEDYKKPPFEKSMGYHWAYYRTAWEYLDQGPQVWVDWVQAEGPLPNKAPLAPARLFGDKPFKDLTREEIREKIGTVALLAFRHRQPQAEYLNKLMAIYDAAIEYGTSKHEAFFDALNPILASPEFLFLYEPREGDNRRPLDGLELASRLSYFFWSAPPDEELYRLAKKDQLRNPDVLAGQVERMLQSEKSAAFVEAFLTQWLELDRLEHVHPAQGAQPTYDDAVRRSSRQEVFETFHHLLRQNEPATAMVDADFVVVNQIMADFYGIPNIRGDVFRKVPLPAGSVRGGLLGQSAILALTGTGERTSPVERGAYVLRKILNRPPPPAPANVPMLDEEAIGAQSIRQTLSQHMNSAQCSSCHRRIDPLGYAMEHFDPVGLWRTKVASSDSSTMFPIETSGVMPDGDRQFANLAEMKHYLVEDREAFVTGLTRALMIYGYGRSVGFTDQELIQKIVAENKSKGYGLRDLLTALVLSEPFITK